MSSRARLSAFYDKDTARAAIDALSLERKDAVKSAISLSFNDELQLKVLEEQNPRFFKIVHFNTDVEAAFRIVGVVTSIDMDYPTPHDSVEDLRHRSQHIKIAGFGSKSFSAGLANIEKLYWEIHRNMPGNSIKRMPVSRFHNHPQVHFKCRFFTTGKDAEEVDNVTPAEHVDASGILSAFLEDANVRHGETNRVFYRKSTPSGYANIPPTSITPGDIAEVEFSVLGAPSHRDGGNFVLIQSRVTVLDDSLSMKAFLAQCKLDSRATSESSAPKVRAKRRQLDDDDDLQMVDQVRSKISRLDVH